MPDAADVLEYWFGPPDSPEFGKRRDVWFKDGRSIDTEIRARFLALHEEAARGALDHWRGDARSCLALIVLFDQFPRHMFRDTARAFATDDLAVSTATHALDAGYDRGRPVLELSFFYLAFAHAEDLAAQRRSVALRRALPEHDGKPKAIERAVEHMEVIARFGRFPHRNDIIGRKSTPEEARFLEENPDAWFAKYRKRPAPEPGSV